MAAAQDQPLSYNLQEKAGFAFNVKRLPATSYFCSGITIPEITLPQVKVPSPSLSIPKIGDHLVYAPLDLQFNVDSNLQNWLEIHNWMTAISNPTNIGKHYKELENNPPWSPYQLTSDISVFKMDSQRNVEMSFTFEAAWPTFLSKLDFSSAISSTQYLQAGVRFMYLRYTFNPIISYTTT